MTRTPPCWQAVLHETRLPTPLLFCCPTQKRYTTSSRKIHRRQPKKRREIIVEETNRYDGFVGRCVGQAMKCRCPLPLSNLSLSSRETTLARSRLTLVTTENRSQPRNQRNARMK
jgi:hypothetical protein